MTIIDLDLTVDAEQLDALHSALNRIIALEGLPKAVRNDIDLVTEPLRDLTWIQGSLSEFTSLRTTPAARLRQGLVDIMANAKSPFDAYAVRDRETIAAAIGSTILADIMPSVDQVNAEFLLAVNDPQFANELLRSDDVA